LIGFASHLKKLILSLSATMKSVDSLVDMETNREMDFCSNKVSIDFCGFALGREVELPPE